MSLNCSQLKDLIERTLTEFDSELITKVSVQLLLATAAQESSFGTYLRQTNGPALGIFQMDEPTFIWLRDYYANKYPQIEHWQAAEMEWDLKKAIIMARLRYRITPEPLPESETAESLWPYYKKFYNSEKGAATQYDFINRVHQYVRC